MDTYGVYSHEVQGDKIRTGEKLNDIWESIVFKK